MLTPKQLLKQLTETLIQPALEDPFNPVCPGLQLEVNWQGHPWISHCWGVLDPTQPQLTQLDSLFDVASLTKLLTATLFMKLVEDQKVALHQSVQSILPDFQGLRLIQPYEDPLNPGHWITLSSERSPINIKNITFKHLLTHTSGLPAWRPLYQQPTPEAAKQMALNTHLSYQPGDQICYSDIGFILLGLAIEQLTGSSLDQVLRQQVLEPLDLKQTRFNPTTDRKFIAPTEWCQWRQHRVRGDVHDENAYRLGGIAGHAGLFSTATDLARWGHVFLAQDFNFLKADTIALMTSPQVAQKGIRRGLGFALQMDHPQASSSPFSQQAFGHTGFTGTSLWIDPVRSIVVVCLTNSLYYGRERDAILSFRVRLHQTIIEALNS